MNDIRPGDIVQCGSKFAMVCRCDGDRALLRRYGADRKPTGWHRLANLERTALVTFVLNDQDIARLREIRRLTFAANEDSPHGWGITDRALAAHLRAALWVFADNYHLDFAEEDLYEARSIQAKRTRPIRVRLPLKLRGRIFEISDDMRRAAEDVCAAAIVNMMECALIDGPPAEAMAIEKRLCAYPASVEKRAQEEIAMRAKWAAKEAEKAARSRLPEPSPPHEETRVSVDVLREAVAEQAAPQIPHGAPWREDGDGLRSVASVATIPEKPKIRPEDVLAMRPLKPPGRA